MADRETGKIKWFNPRKRYGFIVRESGEDIFFHQNSIIESEYPTPRENDSVEFEVNNTPKGLAAANVKVL